MALAVAHVGGGDGGTTDVTSDSWSSTAASLIVAVGHVFNTSAAALATDVTDNKSNTYSLGPVLYTGGAGAIGIWYNNAGTRGAAHTVNYNPPGIDTVNISVVEITGQDLTAAVFDTTTDGTNNDSVSPYNITSAAAISGNQVAVYGLTMDTGDNTPFTAPGGYSVIHSQPDGGGLVSYAAYKLNETGTPTVGATSTHTIGGAGVLEVFATFKEGIPVTIPIAWIGAAG